MDTLLKDMRYGARMLLTRPASSIIAALALALGIGLTAMMFSIIWGALLRGLPFEKSEQLVAVSRANVAAGDDELGVSIHDYQDWRVQQRSFVDLAAYYTGTVNISGIDRPERFDGAFITANGFALVGVEPVLGRGFTPEDDAPGAERVMLLGYDTWQNRFGGDAGVIGRVVRANAQPTTIVGVMPAGFRFPNSEQLWLPLGMDAAAIKRNEGTWLNVFGRMRDGVTIDQANVELAGIARRLEAAYPETNKDISALARPTSRHSLAASRPRCSTRCSARYSWCC